MRRAHEVVAEESEIPIRLVVRHDHDDIGHDDIGAPMIRIGARGSPPPVRAMQAIAAARTRLPT